MHRELSKNTAALLAVFLLFFVGYLDFVTGTEIRIFPLYFFPLMLTARHFGKYASIWVSLLASLIWLVSMYFAGRVYSHSYVWVVNFMTQGATFLVVSILFGNLNNALINEKNYSRLDALTGLLNSRSFYKVSSAKLNLCNRNILPITLAFIDLDNFKQANDTFGHLHGDKLLSLVADIFKKNLRSCDLIARMGGDEFAILLPATDASGANQALEKIRSLIEESPDFACCAVTASIGGITTTNFQNDFEKLLKTADDLMYTVKKKGKNHVVVEVI
jgi:diguanylate cyclase (GGDEF)-like protein